MLGQQNKQYEWHPLIEDKYLIANGHKHYKRDIHTKTMIYEFDRSKSIRLDELLDSLELIRMHGWQAIYLMIQILDHYIKLQQQNLQPKFISTKNIWLILEHGSENFKIVFVYPLKYKICLTYSSEEGDIQTVLSEIISKFQLCQSSTDHKAKNSDRSNLRNQLIQQLNDKVKINNLETALEQITQCFKDFKYTTFESFQNLDSKQYSGLDRRNMRFRDVEKLYQKFSELQYGNNNPKEESEQIQQMRGFFIQNAIVQAKSALITEVSAFSFSEGNIPVAFNNNFVYNTLAKFHYQTRCFQPIFDSFIDKAQVQIVDILTRNLVLKLFGMELKNYEGFVQQLKQLHDDQCQTYLRLKGYFNSIYEFVKFPSEEELEVIEREQFDKHIARILKDKIKDFLNKQFTILLQEINSLTLIID